MRRALVALSLSAFALTGLAPISSASAKPATMSKFGCVVGKQTWNAKDGKCVDAKPVKKAAKSTKKPAPKKAM